jgi:hypothetical protein
MYESDWMGNPQATLVTWGISSQLCIRDDITQPAITPTQKSLTPNKHTITGTFCKDHIWQMCQNSYVMHIFPSLFSRKQKLFTKETRANCNPIYIFSTIITIIITKMQEHKF